MATAIVASLGVTGIGASILSAIISFAISSIFESLFAPDEPEQTEPESEGPLLNKRSNTSSIPVVYGTRRIGGNRVFVATDGDRSSTLHIVLLVCEGEVDGFQDIYLDDNLLRFSSRGGDTFADGSTHKPIGAVERDEFGEDMDTDKYTVDGEGNSKDLVEITFHNGAPNQAADSGLSGRVGWTNDHRLQGRAYVYVRIEYDQDVFSSIPSITTNIRGKTIDLLNGTTGYSENPALCLRDYLTNNDYGRGLDPETIDDEAMLTAATYCDDTIDLLDAAGTVIAPNLTRYTMNGIVKTSDSLYSNTQSILTNMRGFLVFSSGKYRLLLDSPKASEEFIYDESNIIGSLNLSLGSKKNTLNKMRGTFWNPNKNGEDDTVILDEELVRNELDNGVVLSRELQLPYCNSPHTARYLMNQEIEQSRQQLNITFKTGVAGLRNDIGDIIRVKHASMGWGYYTDTVDGEIVLLPEQPITINNIGQTDIIPIWSALINYNLNSTVTFDGQVYVATGDPSTGQDPTNTSVWTLADEFNDIPDVSQFGILVGPNGEVVENLGIGGGFLYKEFRILSLSLMEQEEVELVCMEYDVTVFDNMPLTLEDSTPNTSFANPNIIPAILASTITFKEELYVTSTSGGVKSSIVFNWAEPNTPFVRSYDVFVHRPEEDWDIRDDYAVGSKVTHNNARWRAAKFSGPTSNESPVIIESSNQTVTAGTLISITIGGIVLFYRANTDNAGTDVNTTNLTAGVLGNTALWAVDDGSGAVEPFTGLENAYWVPLTAVDNEDFLFQTSTTGREFTLLDSKPGTHDFRVRANSVTGVRSPITTRSDISVLGLIRPPSDVTGFGLGIQGTLALLTWEPSTDLDVRIGGSIQVRHNPGVVTSTDFAAQNLNTLWNNSAVLTEGKSGVTSQILVPLTRGTYMMKAIDASGIESVTPAAILNEVGSEVQLFPITNIDENPEWPGLPSNTVVNGRSYYVASVTSDNWSSIGGPNPATVGTRFNATSDADATELAALGTVTTDADRIVGNDSSNVELFATDGTLRLSTLGVWSPTSGYVEGDQVLYNGVIYEVRTGRTIGEPTGGANNETPQGELISQWGLISQRNQLVSEDWVSAARDTLTSSDVPQFTNGTYYFSSDITFGAVESQEIAPILTFSSRNIGDSIDNLEEPIDSLNTNIDDLGDPGAAASSSVRMEISTSNSTVASASDIPDNSWSSYTTFTKGSYNFRSARFRLALNTAVLGTQIEVTKAGIETNLPARTINNIISLNWTPADASPRFNNISDDNPFPGTLTAYSTGDLVVHELSGRRELWRALQNVPASNTVPTQGLFWTKVSTGVADEATNGPQYEDVIYNTASGAGSSFFSGGGNLGTSSAEPSLSIVSENIFPGEYFVITNRDPNSPTVNNFENGQEADAPLPHLGFRIRYYRVGTRTVCANATCTTTVDVLGTPSIGTTGNDDLINNKTLNFDYQAQGY